MELIIISIVVLSSLIFVFMPRKRETYHGETGHNARLASVIGKIDAEKHSRRLQNWTK